MTDEKNLHEVAAEMAEAAKDLGERISLKANLLSKDGRDAVEAAKGQLKVLEDKMRHYGFDAKSAAEEARVKARLGMMDARDKFEALHEEARPHIEQLKETGVSEAKEAVEKISGFLKKLKSVR